jgi:hypothetical protein
MERIFLVASAATSGGAVQIMDAGKAIIGRQLTGRFALSF